MFLECVNLFLSLFLVLTFFLQATWPPPIWASAPSYSYSPSFWLSPSFSSLPHPLMLEINLVCSRWIKDSAISVKIYLLWHYGWLGGFLRAKKGTSFLFSIWSCEWMRQTELYSTVCIYAWINTLKLSDFNTYRRHKKNKYIVTRIGSPLYVEIT